MIVIAKLVNLFFQVYTLMIFARIIGSWMPEISQYRLMQFIIYYTDPYLNFFRRFIPPLGMFDFSPIIAFLCLGFIRNVILNLLANL